MTTAAAIWGWREWSGWGAGIGQAAVATLGFAVAIYELRKTRTAAETTADAAERTQLRVLVQGMRMIERDLDASLPNRRNIAIRALNDWRALAAELLGLLTKFKDVPQNLVDSLRLSRELAATAKNDLQMPNRPPVVNATKKARDTISAVADEAAQFIATVK